MAEKKNEKSKKLNKTISNIRDTFIRGSRQDSNKNLCKCKEEQSVDDITIRSRTQRIFRSIKKPFKKKVHECKALNIDREIQAAVNSSGNNMEHPPIPPPRNLTKHTSRKKEFENSQYLDIKDINQEIVKKSLGREHFNLARHGWYWGPMTKQEAENKLTGEPDGAFLIRDSSSERHIFTLTFRSYGKTMHTHIDYNKGVYSVGDHFCNPSISDVIEAAVRFSEDNVFSYSISRNPAEPSYPVRLVKPISRFTEVRTLKYLSRFVIRQYVNVNDIQNLMLPTSLKDYLMQGQY